MHNLEGECLGLRRAYLSKDHGFVAEGGGIIYKVVFIEVNGLNNFGTKMCLYMRQNRQYSPRLI